MDTAPTRRERKHRAGTTPPRGSTPLLALVILFSLALFLAVKIAFRLPSSDNLLYAYGISVTTVVFVQMFVSIILYRDPAETSRIPDDEPTGPVNSTYVSALVAVHNEEAFVTECINSLLDQTYPHMEVIVVDDASTDNTRMRLRDIATHAAITVLELDTNVGKKRALAAAMQRAKGDVIAFTDSDSTWHPEAITKAVQVFEHNPQVGAISGHCRAANAEASFLTRMQDTWYEGQFSVRKAFESHFGAVTCVSGPLAIFRREAIFNYIPAWEQDSFLGQEFRFATDRTLTGYVLMGSHGAKRLRALNVGTPFAEPAYPERAWDIVYSKSVRSLTNVPETLPQVIRQQVRWKKSFVRNLFFTGRFYWRRPFVPALAYYLHVAFVLAGPAVAFRHLVFLPMHGNVESMLLYVSGILLIGSMFGLAYRREDPGNGHRWVYRPLMSLMSTVLLSWLIAYSLLTIKKMNWSRG